MQRDPSIHITLSSFVAILAGIGVENPERVAKTIFKKAMPVNIKNRYIITGDAETNKKAKRVMEAHTNLTVSPEKFNRWLVTIRKAQGHRGVIEFKPTDTNNWLQLTEIAKQCSEFSESLGIDGEEGAKIYITLGLKLMKRNYALNKFKYYREKIISLYVAADTVQNDVDSENTQKVYGLWRKYMMKYGKFVHDLTNAEDFVYMVYVRMEADAVGAQYSDWLKAQFEYFQVWSIVPALAQLVTENALKRYYEYMPRKAGGTDKIKNDVTDYKDDFSKRYFEATRKGITEGDRN